MKPWEKAAQNVGGGKPWERAAQQAQSEPAPAPKPLPEEMPELTDRQKVEQGIEPSAWDTVKSLFTGEGREAAETMGAPELHYSGILHGEEKAKVAAIAPALLTMTDPAEIAQSIQSNFPNVRTQWQKAPDGSVYPVMTNNETGAQTVINRPGFTGLDVIQTLGLGAAYAPTGASTVAGAGLKAGGMGALLEGSHALAGGDFNPETVVLDALTGSAGQKLFGGKTPTQEELKEITEQVRKSFEKKGLFTGESKYATGPTEVAEQKLKKALAEGDVQKVSNLVEPDQGFIEAGQKLGLQEEGLASHASQNPAFIAQEQAMKSAPGSNLELLEDKAVKELKDRADDLINQMGGTLEKGSLSKQLVDDTQRAIKALEDNAELAYKEISDAIPKGSIVDTDDIGRVLANELENVGGRVDQLTGIERSLINFIDGDVTYHALDKMRKRIGAQMQGKGEIFKDAEKAELSRYYGLLTDVQEKAFPEMAGKWAQAKQLVSQRKALEKRAVETFGKDLSREFMPQMGQAALALGKGQAAKFDKLLASVPQDQRQRVVASALNDVFTGGRKAETQLSIGSFASWYDKISRDQAMRDRIWGNLDPEMGDLLDALGKRTQGINKARQKEVRTGRIAGHSGVMEKVFGGVLAKALPGVMSDFIQHGFSGLKDQPAKNALSLLSDPKFTADLKYLVSGNAKQMKAAEQRLMRNKNWINAAKAHGFDTSVRVSGRELLNAMGGNGENTYLPSKNLQPQQEAQQPAPASAPDVNATAPAAAQQETRAGQSVQDLINTNRINQERQAMGGLRL